jgi:hypothetical protein
MSAIETWHGWSVLALALNVTVVAAPPARAEASAGKIAALAWMAGSWSGAQEGVASEEHWTSPAGGALIGLHKDVKEGRMTTFEFLRIEVDPVGRVCYLASPRGVAPASFCAIELGERRVVFENRTHDFPQRILYWLDAEARLHARVVGPMDGREVAEEWIWSRSVSGRNPVAWEPELELPTSLEPRRQQLAATLAAALERVRSFARSQGWQGLTEESFFDRVRIFDRKPDFDRALLEVAGLDPATPLPATYSAALENRILMAVSPELYAAPYPEGVEEASYEKLLAHEIAHRLHVRILGGDEEAMGPIWFYEGFAIYAADQLRNAGADLPPEELWRIVADSERRRKPWVRSKRSS